MKEVDKNKDGMITFEEFSDVMNLVIGSTFTSLNSIVGIVSKKFKKQITQ